MTDFYSKILSLCDFLSKHPNRLEEKYPEMKKKLDLSCGNGQGTGNKSTDQESAFATILEEFGWTHISKSENPSLPYCYIYQPHGTQLSPDFKVVSNSPTIKPISFDLKHSIKDSIYLNDGKFLTDIIYVISFTRTLPRVKGCRKCERENICALVLGQEILSEKDSKALQERYDILKKLNETHIDTDFLYFYCRSANQYSCKQFTNEFNAKAFLSLKEFILKNTV